MTEHFLHGSQVSASFDEVCREGMSESMRTDTFFQIYFFSELFDDGENHNPAELASSLIEENDVFIPGFNGKMTTNFIHVNFNVLDGDTANWHQAFFVTFSSHFYKSNFKVQI